MPEPGSQLPLDLSLEPRFGAEDFLVSECNADAYGRVESWPDWPGGMLALVGPAAAGKSHLAAIWAERSNARIIAARALEKAGLPGLVSTGAVVVEDADRHELAEAALFHIVNLLQERGGSLLITGRQPPASWTLRTADLSSRLRRMPVVEIAPPDDSLIRTLLVKMFVDRQLVVDTTLVAFLAVRIERSFSAVRETVDRLDRESLARGKRLTRSTASKILGLSEDRP